MTMKRASYRHAIAWLTGDSTDARAIVAVIFDVPAKRVARDIAAEVKKNDARAHVQQRLRGKISKQITCHNKSTR